MKILQVNNFLSPLHGGGSIEVVYQLSKVLVQRGHDVTIYTSDFELDQNYINALSGVKTSPFHSLLNLAGLQLTPGLINTSRKDLNNFDVIHMHNHRTFQNIVIHHYAQKYGIPYVLQAHGSATTYFQRGVLKRVFDRMWGYRILQDAAKLIALTSTEVEQYESLGVKKDKIEIVPNGIDLAEFENLPPRGEFRKQYGLSDNEKIVLYLGRIHQVKGIDLLVKAFCGLPESLGKVRLVIVGPDDGYLPALKKLIVDLEVNDKVLFTGPLYRQEKLKAYVDAEVYVLPSVYEIFGITVLEALGCGTPVIVTDRCGIAEWISNKAVHVVPCDEDQMQVAIFEVLTASKGQLPKDAKKLISERLAWSKVAERIEDIYESVRK